MNQEQLNKILQMVGELTINLRFANEEIARLRQQLEEQNNAKEAEDNVVEE